MLLPQGMSSSFVIGLSLVWLWRSSHGDHSQYIILLPFPFVVFKLKLSWRNLNLLLLVLFVIENSCQFCCCCCCYPTSPLKIFFFCLCRLNHSFFPFHVLCLGSLLWALIFGTSLMPQVDLTMPAKSGSAEQTRRITLPVLQAILQLIYLIWWLLFSLTVWYCWLMFSLWSSITSHIVFWRTATYPVIFCMCSWLILLNWVTLLLFHWITSFFIGLIWHVRIVLNCNLDLQQSCSCILLSYRLQM